MTAFSPLLILALTAHPTAATEAITSPEPTSRSRVSADLVGRVAPAGIMLLVGGAHRLSLDGREPNQALRYVDIALRGGVNPAYAQVGPGLEIAPVPFLVLSTSYDLFGYFGAFSSLLSFDSADADFSDDVLENRRGEERAGSGHRWSSAVTARGRVGPVVARVRGATHRYWLGAAGPFLYEWEFDTLLEKHDWLFESEATVLFELWKGRAAETLMLGPSWDLAHAAGTDLRRQRLGAKLWWTLPVDWLRAGRPHVFAHSGVRLESPNRDPGAPFVVLGVGTDLDL